MRPSFSPYFLGTSSPPKSSTGSASKPTKTHKSSNNASFPKVKWEYNNPQTTDLETRHADFGTSRVASTASLTSLDRQFQREQAAKKAGRSLFHWG